MVETVIGLKLVSATKVNDMLEIVVSENHQKVKCISRLGNDLLCIGDSVNIKIDRNELKYFKRLNNNKTLILTKEAMIVCDKNGTNNLVNTRKTYS